jgi:hypothetical protein
VKPTGDILSVWKRFDSFPMETITKAWYHASPAEKKQRSVELMEQHREQYGLSGNCFDLAIWLVHEFAKHGITSYGVGHDLFSEDAHAAVVAVNHEGYRYFCDLGDQWIQPILIDKHSPDYSEDILDYFFPGSRTQLAYNGDQLLIKYIRPNGKFSTQHFNLTPIDLQELIAAGEHSQGLLRQPLVEQRIFTQEEVLHWEYDNGVSFLSSNERLEYETALTDTAQWAERIYSRTGMNKTIVKAALDIYANLARNL